MVNLDLELFLACENNDPFLVFSLLKRGASIDRRDFKRNNFTSLIHAAINNHYNVVLILLLFQNNLQSEALYYYDDQGPLLSLFTLLFISFSLAISLSFYLA